MVQKNRYIPKNQEQVHHIVEDLYKYGGLKPSEIHEFKEYEETLKYNLKTLEFMIEESENTPSTLLDVKSEVEVEIEWCSETFIYTTDYASLFNMNQTVNHLYTCLLYGDDYKLEKSFFKFLQLVKWINAYFKIGDPYKAPNKIAYGWKFALDKGAKAFRPYLYGCIRNYLNKNGVEWKTIELQKICALKVVDTNSE